MVVNQTIAETKATATAVLTNARMLRPSSAVGDNAQPRDQFPYDARFTVLAIVPVWGKRVPASVLTAVIAEPKLSD